MYLPVGTKNKTMNRLDPESSFAMDLVEFLESADVVSLGKRISDILDEGGLHDSFIVEGWGHDFRSLSETDQGVSHCFLVRSYSESGKIFLVKF